MSEQLLNGVSVIICCYNSAWVISRSLGALKKQIVAPDLMFEIVLVDNNCTDDPVNVARKSMDSCGIDMSKWRRNYSANRPLVLKRNDKELSVTDALKDVLKEVDADVCDWPPMEEYTLIDRVRDAIRRRSRKLGFMYEPYMYHVYRPYLIRSVIQLINSHTDIYTTRLHACILSILLGKEKIVFFDNSYGKNRNFYDTWLKDCDSVKMV